MAEKQMPLKMRQKLLLGLAAIFPPYDSMKSPEDIVLWWQTWHELLDAGTQLAVEEDEAERRMFEAKLKLGKLD